MLSLTTQDQWPVQCQMDGSMQGQKLPRHWGPCSFLASVETGWSCRSAIDRFGSSSLSYRSTRRKSKKSFEVFHTKKTHSP